MTATIELRRRPNGKPYYESQWQQVHAWLKAAGPEGVHTFQMRAALVGNPSERMRQLDEHGIAWRGRDEKYQGDAKGTRFWLEDMAPADATKFSKTRHHPTVGIANGLRTLDVPMGGGPVSPYSYGDEGEEWAA